MPLVGNGGPEFNQVQISVQHHDGAILVRRPGPELRIMLVAGALLVLSGCNMIGGAFSSVGNTVFAAGNKPGSDAAQATEQQAPLGTGTSNERIERLEQEVRSLRAELSQLKPSIERLVGIEDDIRLLLTQLSRLIDPNAHHAGTTGVITPPDSTEKAVQPTSTNPDEEDLRILLKQLLRLTDPRAAQIKTAGETTLLDNSGGVIQPTTGNPAALLPAEKSQQEASPGQPQSLRPMEQADTKTAVPAAPTQLTSISPSVAPSEQISIHLASFREQDLARQGWRELQSAYSDLLGGLDYRISTVQLSGGRGTFYRVKAGPFTDKSSAEEICSLMKSRNAYCVLSDFNGKK